MPVTTMDTIIADLERKAAGMLDHGASLTDASAMVAQAIQHHMGLPVAVPENQIVNYSILPGHNYKQAVLTPTLTGKKLQGYCVVWLDSNGNEFIDETLYHDHVARGSWKATILDLQQQARNRGHDYLLPLLWHHIPPKEGGTIGKVTALEEDERGVAFTATLADTPRAQEAYAHAKNGTAAASYRFAPVEYEFLPHPKKQYQTYRRIKRLNVDEISIIPVHSGAANPYTFVEAKSLFSSANPSVSIENIKRLLLQEMGLLADLTELFAKAERE